MDPTAQDLVALLIKSIPTIVFFVILTLYLKFVFFKPLARVLDERRQQTEGVRALAQQAFEAADKKTAEFERALQLARAEIHKDNEALRQQWLKEQTEAIDKARQEAERHIGEAKQQIAQEVERAQQELSATVNSLSERIVQSLSRRAA